MSSTSSTTGTSQTPGSDAFLESLLSMVNQEDMVAILKAQSQMLDRFEKTNEMLSNFNRLSSKRYEKTFEQFKEHTETLLMMKKDLDMVFRRIRTLKKKLATDYPRAFVAALEDVVPPDLDEEDEEPQSRLSHSPSNHPQLPQQPLQHPPEIPRQQEHSQKHHQRLPQQLERAKHPPPQLPQHPPQHHPPHFPPQQKHRQPHKQQSLDLGASGSKVQGAKPRHGSDSDK